MKNYELQNACNALAYSCENLGERHPATLAIKKRVHDLRAENKRNEKGGRDRVDFAAAFRSALATPAA